MFKSSILLVVCTLFLVLSIGYSGTGYYKIIQESGSTNDLKQYQDIYVGWLDLGDEKYKNYGYSDKDDWIAIIRSVNIRGMTLDFNGFLPEKNVNIPIDSKNELHVTNGLVIKFTDVDFNLHPGPSIPEDFRSSSVLSATIHFIDGKSGNELYSCSIVSPSFTEGLSINFRFKDRLNSAVYNLVRFIATNTQTLEKNSEDKRYKTLDKNENYKIINETTPISNFNQYQEIYLGWLDLGEEKYEKYGYDESSKEEFISLLQEENQTSMPKYFKNFVKGKTLVSPKGKNELPATNGLVIQFTDADYKEGAAVSRLAPGMSEDRGRRFSVNVLYVTVHFIDGTSGKELYSCRISATSENQSSKMGYVWGNMTFAQNIENAVYNMVNFVAVKITGPKSPPPEKKRGE